MTDEKTISIDFIVTKNTPELLIIRDKMNKITRDLILKKAELLDDFIYKNLETNTLQGMKLKIENELMERKLKDYER